MLLILVGIVYLLFGFSIAKILVTLNAALVGGWIGALVGERTGGGGAALPGAVILGLLSATAAWPTLRGSVAVLGAMLGAILGVVVWRLSDLDPTFGWSRRPDRAGAVRPFCRCCCSAPASSPTRACRAPPWSCSGLLAPGAQARGPRPVTRVAVGRGSRSYCR